MYSAGLTPSHIAKHYKMSRNTAKTIIRRSKQVPIVTSNTIGKRNGRKPKLLTENYEHLINYVRKRIKEPLYTIAVQYRTRDGQPLSARTIRRYLHNNGIRSYVAASKTYLSAEHVAARLN